MASRIGVDIGGTFTDLIYYDEETGSLLVEKVPTTPASPEQGCIDAVRKAVPAESLSKAAFFLHGTTVGLNALLERRGAIVGLLTTAGFRDVLEIGRGTRAQQYSLTWAPQPPLVPRRLRLPVRERVHADGHVAIAVVAQDVFAALEHFRAAHVSAIAVACINAYANPANELEMERLLRAAGFDGAISLSHRVSGEYGEYERTSTTVIDAFVRARMAKYLAHIERELAQSDFRGVCLLTRSGSGSMSFAEAQERPFESIMSGPVAGAEGASELSRSLELGDLITADVGGTSFDTCVILNGRPQLQFQGEVAGMPLKASWVDVRSIGAGGGSVAYVDAGGGLRVGPRSSGALPGPACYGRGGEEPCVTDAAFFLGMLGEGRLASGLQLDLGRAEYALKTISGPLGYNAEQAARGIIQIASANMANAIREITVEQGIDPRKLKLLAFGGAGPLLATQLARELSIAQIVVPPHAGNFSAWGLLGADVVRSSSVTRLMRLTEGAMGPIDEVATVLMAELTTRAGRAAVNGVTVKELTLDMRYEGQEHTLPVPLAMANGQPSASFGGILRAFESAYVRGYGAVLDQPVEIVAVRAALRQPLPRRKASQTIGIHEQHSTVFRRAMSFATDGWHDFPILSRAAIQLDSSKRGPAIIHEPTTTTYVDADFTYRIDANYCLWLTRVSPLTGAVY